MVNSVQQKAQNKIDSGPFGNVEIIDGREVVFHLRRFSEKVLSGPYIDIGMMLCGGVGERAPPIFLCEFYVRTQIFLL